SRRRASSFSLWYRARPCFMDRSRASRGPSMIANNCVWPCPAGKGRGYRCIAHDRRGQWPLEPALGGATILLTGEKGQTRLTTRGTDHQPQTSEEIIAEILGE